MKYLKAFKAYSEYTNFKNEGDDWITPNVCFIKDNKKVKMNPKRYVCFTASDSDFLADDAEFYSIAGAEFYND